MTDEAIDILSGKPPKDKRTRCYYNEWFNEQTPQFQEAIAKAMDRSSKWKTVDIFSLVRDKKGYEKQYNSLRMHRAGECSCG